MNMKSVCCQPGPVSQSQQVLFICCHGELSLVTQDVKQNCFARPLELTYSGHNWLLNYYLDYVCIINGLYGHFRVIFLLLYTKSNYWT
jgi:hypothetical protein